MRENFRALRVEEVSRGIYETHLSEQTFSDLPEEDLLVAVEYSSLNYKDALSAHGNKGVTKRYPHTPGIDAAGVVLSDRSGRFAEGEKVIVTGKDLGMNTPGGLAEYIRIPSDWAVPLPATMSTRDAMTLGTAGLTAFLCIQKLQAMGANPEDGEVVVTGATGGVGSLAVALLSHIGFRVAAVTGKLEASEYLVNLGAAKIIDRNHLNELVRKPLANPQWAHGIDCLGGEYLFSVAKSLHYGGSVAACGLAASADFSANVFPFILRNINLLGVDSVELPLTTKRHAWEQLAGPARLKNLDQIAEQISLEQAPTFLRQIMNGHAFGRYLVAIN